MNPKRITQAALVSKIAALKRRGKTIVFTNGCFDLLHAGHVRYLAAARAMGDLLVVGVNSDASVRRLKGPTRPIVPLSQRMEVLAALSAVDYVVPFGAATPLGLITALAPDILVKGADWATTDIVGKEIVEQGGGRVARVRITPNLSTTRLIARIVSQQTDRDCHSPTPYPPPSP